MNQQVSPVVPASIVTSVQQRLAGLSTETVDVLTAAAILGSQFDLTLLGDVAGVGEHAAISALNAASGVQLVQPRTSDDDEFSFRHPLIREAIVADLHPADRATRARQAAVAIELAHPDLPGSWCELAVDMHEIAGDAVRSAELRLELGRRALQHGAFASATDVLSTARALLEGTPSAPDRLLVDIDNAIARAFELTGDTARLIPAADRLIAGLDQIGADQLWKAHVHIRMARAFSASHPDRTDHHLAVARTIAATAQDQALTARLDAVAARCAMDADRPDAAAELASRALAAAQAAGLRGWAGETGFEALDTIGRRAQLSGDLAAAGAAFEQADRIAADEHRPNLRIRARHQIGIIQVLQTGASGKLSEARDLASRAGAISTMALIELELATARSVGRDLDGALAAARSCQELAHRIRQPRVEALAWGVQAAIAGLRRESGETEHAARQAELLMPGDPEVLLVTWGQGRATASLFSNDIAQARAQSHEGIRHGRLAKQRRPRPAWALWALLEVVSGGPSGQAALDEARAAGTVGAFNDGFLGYAGAVLAGRLGRPEQAAELAGQASRLLTAFGPWWDQLARWLAAPCAAEDQWGEPAQWLRDTAAGFRQSGHEELAIACRSLLRDL